MAAGSITFTNLLSQYVPGSYLVETKHGTEFRNQTFVLFRWLEKIFLRSHFELENSAPPLINRAKEALQNTNQSVQELKSMVKVLYITKKILYNASLSQKGRLCAESQQETELAGKALNKLAEILHQSQLSVCLELAKTQPEMYETAYKLAQGNSFTDLSPSQLSLLATITWEKIDPPFMHRLIDAGGIPSVPSLDGQNSLLIDCLDQFNDNRLATLIRGGYHCTFDYGDPPLPFAFACIKQGMTESIKAMIEKKVPLSYMKDEEENTLLHYAFLLGNGELIKTLSQIIDPTLKNNQGQTPLAGFLAPETTISQYMQVPEGRTKAFLEDLIGTKENDRARKGHRKKPKRKDHFHTALQNLPKSNCLPKCNDIELAFLLGLDEITSALFSQISRNELETNCAELGKKYLKEATERFFLSSFSFKEEHFKTGCETVSLSTEIEGNPQPKDLITMLNELGTFSRNDQHALKKYLEKVRNRKAYTGTPDFGSSALEAFYQTIETNIKHIVFSLRQKNDPQLTSATLREFIDAARFCGGRLYSVAWQQALQVCCGAKTDPKSNLERSLALFRYLCLEDCIRALYNDERHNVHYYNRALHDLGEKLGIPQWRETTRFTDRLCPNDYSEENVLSFFSSTYTPYSIIFDYLLPQLKTDVTFRNDYIDLQKTVVLRDWVVPEVEGEPTEEQKWYDFLSRFVHNEAGELQPSAIRYLLEKLNIISCNLK